MLARHSSTPRVAGEHGESFGVAVAGNYVYLADKSGGLQVIERHLNSRLGRLQTPKVLIAGVGHRERFTQRSIARGTNIKMS